MKKLLLFILLGCISFSFAQQKSTNATSKNQIIKTISNITSYPNPFTYKTQISFISSSEQTINLSVKNLLGKTVYNQTSKAKKGFNSLKFNRNNLAKGMYIYSLQTNHEVISKRLIIR